jgi:excisionase family DNA binding protein
VDRETITAREAAEYLGISYWKLLQLVKVGKIPHIRLPGRVLFRRKTLDEWMEEQERISVRTEEKMEQKGKIRKLRPIV